MEWVSWVTPAAGNLSLWFLMLGLQALDAKAGRIGQRSRDFLHLQDFHTNGCLGDVLALSLVDAAAGGLLWEAEGLVIVSSIPAALAVGVLAAVSFYQKRRRSSLPPDWGFPLSGEVSRGGKLHLAYFGLQAGVAVLGVLLLLDDLVSGVVPVPALLLGGTGALLYGLAVLLDHRRGVIVL